MDGFELLAGLRRTLRPISTATMIAAAAQIAKAA
jgi:hypothetical protein